MDLVAPKLFDLAIEIIWPFMRIGAMFMAVPVFGARSVPVRVRVLLAVLITWLIYPLIPELPGVSPLSAEGIVIAVQQVLVGVSTGFMLQLVFAAMVLAGQITAMSMGLGFASAIDPQNGVQVPVVSQYLLVLTTLVFLALNGHLLVIKFLVDSFHTFPVALQPWPEGLAMGIVSWASNMFAGALLIALPVVSALLLVNLSFGVMTRAAPQLNIFAVGFPISIFTGFIVLMFSLVSLLPRVTGLFELAFNYMSVFLI